MESVPYFSFILFNAVLAGGACLSLTIIVLLISLRLAKPALFSSLPKLFREPALASSALLFAFLLAIGLTEFLTVRENLYWASQPRVCLQAPLGHQHFIQIINHRDGYLGALFDTSTPEARVKAISEYTVIGDYLIGGSGLSSDSFFIYDLSTRDYHPGLSREALISELEKDHPSADLSLTPILRYCDVVACSPCDQ
jgi:hypothetical protein